MKTNNNTSLFQRDQVMESLKQSFVKLNPKIMVKNPVMFTVEISTLIMFIVTLFSATNDSQGSFAYNLLVFIILLLTLLRLLPRLVVRLRPTACARPVKRLRPS